MTFVVFRDKPHDKWPADENRADAGNYAETFDAGESDLAPGRLAPADSVASTVDVFVGVYRDKILKIAEHPAAIILEAAANKLVVFDTQLPASGARDGYRDRQWARVRVALRDADDIQRLADFLTDICGKMAGALDASHIVAVRTVPEAPLRVIYGPEIFGSDHGREAVPEIPVLTTDLDIVNGYTIEDESPTARTWRILTICGDARSNIESDIVHHLAAVRGHFQARRALPTRCSTGQPSWSCWCTSLPSISEASASARRRGRTRATPSPSKQTSGRNLAAPSCASCSAQAAQQG